MGLAEQINPEQEALCIVVDKGIYVWAYDKPQKILTHKHRITGLATKNTRLVYCDGINGIRDSLENKVISSYPWWKITTCGDGALAGVLDPAINELVSGGTGQHLIMDVENDHTLGARDGTVNLLAGQPFLMDAGEYAAHNAHGDLIPDASIYETLRNKIAIAGRPWSFEHFTGIAPTDKADELYVALNSTVERRKIGDLDPMFARAFNEMMKQDIPKEKQTSLLLETPKEDVLFRLTSPVYKKFLDIAQLSNYFINRDLPDATREKVWTEFNKKLEDIATFVPKSFSKLKYHKRKPAIALQSVAYKDALKYYEPVLNAVKDQEQEGWELLGEEEPPHPLGFVFRVALMRLKNHCFDKYGIYSMAKCNNKLAIGLGTGELVIKDLTNPTSDPWVYWHFGKPIEAMLTVPIEVFNDGIKQRVLERIRQRAYFAGHSKMYKFEGIPLPLRKTG